LIAAYRAIHAAHHERPGCRRVFADRDHVAGALDEAARELLVDLGARDLRAVPE
jgi:hypothetical protein